MHDTFRDLFEEYVSLQAEGKLHIIVVISTHPENLLTLGLVQM